MVPWVYPTPHPKRHLDRFRHFCRAQDCDRPTVRQTIGRIYIIVRCRLIISCVMLQRQTVLTKWHNISEMYNVHLYQSMNFWTPLVYCNEILLNDKDHQTVFVGVQTRMQLIWVGGRLFKNLNGGGRIWGKRKRQVHRPTPSYGERYLNQIW